MKRILFSSIFVVLLPLSLYSEDLDRYEKELVILEDEAGRIKAEILHIRSEISSIKEEIQRIEDDIKRTEEEVINILKTLNLMNIESRVNSIMYKDLEMQNIRFAEYIRSLILRYNENTSRLKSLKQDYEKNVNVLNDKLNESVKQEELLLAKISKVYALMADRERVLKLKTGGLMRELLSSQREESSKKIESMANREGSLVEEKEKEEDFRIIWPVREGEVIREFGTYLDTDTNLERFSKGILIKSPFLSEVFCVADGKVVFAGWLKGFGNTVIIEHRGGYISVYSHLARIEVKRDDEVKGMEVLGFVGDTGSNEGVALYFELRKRGKAIDPMNFLK